ncbi:hypothetical protein [Viscerimonas tarda]
MKVIFDDSIDEYFSEVIDILYKKEYFGFKESAYKYVDDLIDEINLTIHNKHKRPAPDYFSKYGRNLFYSVFKKNDNTQWYVFFNQEKDVYFIRYIGNNHVCSQYL